MISSGTRPYVVSLYDARMEYETQQLDVKSHEEAISAARALAHHRRVDLWFGNRKIGSFPPRHQVCGERPRTWIEREIVIWSREAAASSFALSLPCSLIRRCACRSRCRVSWRNVRPRSPRLLRPANGHRYLPLISSDMLLSLWLEFRKESGSGRLVP